ncbi:MAG: flagellar filament outer layer protein FlaA [Leptospirales bacterium]|jgi:hypothetical protein
MTIRRKIRPVALAAALLVAPGASSPAAPAKPPAAGVEQAIIFADFETGTDWRLGYRVLSRGTGSASVGELETPPIPGSKRYLYISFRAEAPTGLRVRPPKSIRFSGYVRRFEFWAMGTGHADEIYLDLVDAAGREHRVTAGRLDYFGWRRLQVVPAPELRQRAMDGRTGIQFRGLYLNPAARSTSDRYSLFSLRVYADHFIAFTRDHSRLPPDRWSELKL